MPKAGRVISEVVGWSGDVVVAREVAVGTLVEGQEAIEVGRWTGGSSGTFLET